MAGFCENGNEPSDTKKAGNFSTNQFNFQIGYCTMELITMTSGVVKKYLQVKLFFTFKKLEGHKTAK
jgi:hypothetical protein